MEKSAFTSRDTAPSLSFDSRLRSEGKALERSTPRVLQVNVGKLCNLTCVHCHVNAGPKRSEIMARETVDRIIEWVRATDIEIVDLTGGAPEMIPDFRHFVAMLAADGRHIIDRCNLTILLEPGYEDLAGFLRDRGVEIVASMPCYQPENVTEQRGEGVFDASIAALQLLNEHGYGIDEKLPLHLVYNPNGASLPPDQAGLEADYKVELEKHFGIRFHRLYTITNMPVARFSSWLKRNGRFADYMQLLIDSFNPASVEGLMCRDTLSVDWLGNIYDCDFNQQLGMTLSNNGHPLKLWEIGPGDLGSIPIRTGQHCFGCTAGAGSSCSGSLA